MDVYYEAITPKSYRLWAVKEGAGKDSPYSLRINLEDRGNGVCEAAGAIGELNRDLIIKIGLAAIELGWHTMTTKALKGTSVTSFLTLEKSDEKFDYYTVDLLATAKALGIET